MTGISFDTFGRQPQDEWYRSSLQLDGQQVAVAVSADLAQDASGAEERASDAVLWTASNTLELLLFCADELLDDYNTGWADEGEKLDRPKFVKRLDLVALEVRADGTLRWTYRSRLFRGHEIVVESDTDRHLTSAYLEG